MNRSNRKFASSAPERQLIISGDGSHTLFVPHLNEHYHSTHGAIQESRHIFIEAGLRKAINAWKEVNLLEVGFGTGLNTLLSCLETTHSKVKINYVAAEPFPLPESIWSQFNYDTLLEDPEAGNCFRKICQAEWNVPVSVTPWFTLTKLDIPLQELSLNPEKYHLVYFDAFSPESQPEMWTEEVFRKLVAGMVSGGFLMTYSCKGIVKRAMKSAGFLVEKLPGPPGKREFLLACKL